MNDSLARRIRSDQLSLNAFTPAAPAAHGRLTPTPSQRLARFTLLLQSLFQFLYGQYKTRKEKKRKEKNFELSIVCLCVFSVSFNGRVIAG
jgi:hypothetical protein